MSLESLASATSASANAKTNEAALNGTGTLGQNEFLKLMMAQLKNQDPMKPLDPTAFVSQLAQFSTVTSIENMGTTLTDLSDSMRSSQVLSGSSMIGRDVLAAGESAVLTAGGTIKGAVELPEAVTDLSVSVYDAGGQLVKTFEVSPAKGINEFTWDGTKLDGTAAAAGSYSFEVTATYGGADYAVEPLFVSRVASVTIDSRSNELTLNTNNGAYALDDVLRVM